MHSLITAVPHNGKAGWYETFRNLAYLAISSKKCRVLLIGDSIIANFRNFSHIFDKQFSKFHPLSFGIGGDKIQNVLWRINNMSFPPIFSFTVVQTTLGIMIQRLFWMA